jgi:O-antigen/teichoic acid export membrane protein
MHRRLAVNFSFELSADMIGKLLNFFTHLFLARVLGERGMGQLGGMGAYLYFFGVFASFGLDQIFLREAGRRPEDFRRLLGNTVLLRMGLGLAALAAANGLVGWVGRFEDIRLIIAIGSAGFMVQALQPFRQVFVVALNTRRPALLRILSAAVNLVGVVVLVTRGGGVSAVVAWGVVTTGLEGLAWLVLSRTLTPPRWQPSPRLWGYLLRESWWLLIPQVFISLYTRMDQVFLFQWTSEAETGHYYVAVRLVELAHAFPLILGSLLLPQFGRLAREEPERFRELYRRVFRLLAFLVVPLCGAMSVWARPLVEFLYGAEYRPAADMLTWLVWSNIWVFLGVINNGLLIALKKQSLDVVFTGGNAILNIVLNVLLIPVWGGVGAAVATSISYAFGAFAGLLFATSRPLSRALLGALVAPLLGLTAGAGVLLLGGVASLWAAPAALGVHLAVQSLVGGFGRSDVRYWTQQQ